MQMLTETLFRIRKIVLPINHGLGQNFDMTPFLRPHLGLVSLAFVRISLSLLKVMAHKEKMIECAKNWPQIHCRCGVCLSAHLPAKHFSQALFGKIYLLSAT